MNELDQFVKHKLKVIYNTKYYIRYADDFALLSESKEKLIRLTPIINEFLKTQLKLELHPNKVFIKTLASGVDFLGWVNFTDHMVLRRTTKRRMFKWIREYPALETIASYLGLLKHGNMRKVRFVIDSYLEIS